MASLALVAALLHGCGGDDGAGAKGKLTVSAAASLKDVFTRYGKQFQEASVRFSFAGSDALAAQIRSGVKPDVFASANTRLPDMLYVEGLVEKPLVFASNELVLARRAGDRRITSLRSIMKRGVRVAIGSESVPVGSYTRTVLTKLPRRDFTAIMANVRTEEPDVTGIVGKLVQGAVDAGFVYHTDVVGASGRLEEMKLPSDLSPSVKYGVALVKGAPNPLAAKAFIFGLLSGAGRDALDGAAFGAPAPT